MRDLVKNNTINSPYHIDLNNDFDRKLQNYAILIVHWAMNVQEGQLVNLSGEIFHRKLLLLIAQQAYRRGAKYVNIDLFDPWQAHLRISENRNPENLSFVPSFIPEKFNVLIDTNGATLKLRGSEEPDCCADLPPHLVNETQKGLQQSLHRYYEEGVGKRKVQWTIAAAATPKWAHKVFPELPPEAATAALWELIFKICRVDTPDFLERWKTHNHTLQQRARRLTRMQIKELHFTGPGTDLKVYLSRKAQFIAGGDTGVRGVHYECNIPTEECFTTPDYRLTTGHARITRPFKVNEKTVKNLKLEFKEGQITHFEASEGQEAFAAYIKSDPGSCRLGEVALVGIDSPIFQCGRVFDDILYDENAACHIAVGFAYHFCLENGEELSKDELAALGCNSSCVHTDMMISDAETDLFVTTYTGERLPLLLAGKWQI